MIGRLRGLIWERGDDELILDVAGVGYVVRCGTRLISQVPELGAELILHIESQTREDGTRLYGFVTKDEKMAFNALLGVQGVGPKAALSVLDILTPSELAQCVAHEDKAKIGRANGVGPKLAQRLVIELKGKVLFSDGFMPTSAAPVSPITKISIAGEAVAGLMGLGIAEIQARLAVEQAVKQLGPEAELSVLIRTALKALGK